MATKLFTIRSGQRAQDVVLGAGAAVAAETITLNLDRTTMTKGDFINCMEELQRAVLQGPWPPS